MTTSLISGIQGQLGSFIADQELDIGREVVGIIRRTSQKSTQNIDHLACHDGFSLVNGDITDPASLANIIKAVKPDYIYHMAAMSHVGLSWNQPIHTMNTTGMGVINILEAVRLNHKQARVYLAGSSEVFGNQPENLPYGLSTPMRPASPYGVAKAALRDLGRVYRESHGMFVSVGILFNSESERRGLDFVTRKITHAVARIKHKQQEFIELGNLEAKRDWTYAGDSAKAIQIVLNHSEPDEFIIATGRSHSVLKFVQTAFKAAEISDWEKYIKINEYFKRPNDIEILEGDSTKVRLIGWHPTVSFEDMIMKMVAHDLDEVRKEKQHSKLGTRSDEGG